MWVFYKDIDHDSNVLCYWIGPDFIKVRFKDYPYEYLYNYIRPGEIDVEEMKRLAPTGDELNRYIKKNVGSRFFSKTKIIL